jgi:hypothetical protein
MHPVLYYIHDLLIVNHKFNNTQGMIHKFNNTQENKISLNIQFMNKTLYNKFIVLLTSRLL